MLKFLQIDSNKKLILEFPGINIFLDAKTQKLSQISNKIKFLLT
jgi:hypothetical protein